MKQQDPKPSEGERVARALESIAGSLAKLANPPLVMAADGIGRTIQEWGRAQEQHILDHAKPKPVPPRGDGGVS